MDEPKIVERGPVMLVGMGFYGDPFASSAGWTEENEIGRLWDRFVAYLEEHADGIQHATNPRERYEVHISHTETPAKGHYEVFVGIEVAQLENVPVQLVAKAIPAGEYVHVTLHGAEITSDWAFDIYGEWLPAAGYEAEGSYMFQVYDERFKGVERLEESVLEAYLPVHPRTG